MNIRIHRSMGKHSGGHGAAASGSTIAIGVTMHLCLAVVPAAVVVPHRDSPAGQTAAVETAIVRGTVLAVDTRAPVTKAIVVLEAEPKLPGPTEATTDADGRFEFRAVAPGRYRMTARPDRLSADYLPVTRDEGLAVDLTSGQTVN